MTNDDMQPTQDDDTIQDHVATECMEALESKDTEKFMASLHVLIADILDKLKG